MATKYEDVHRGPNGPGDARPTALQIVQDEHLEGNWSDRTILITGCSSGIGIETAKALHETGATIYATARDLNKAKSALATVLDSGRIHPLELDLQSFASVRRCAETFLAECSRLNVLINNAGVMATPEGRTADGFETQFGTNHLAHFLLIQLLLPILQQSSTPEFQSRVVILSSVAHRDGEVNFHNLKLEGEYDAWKAYAQSKTANIWTSNEIDRRFGPKGVHSLSVHPGAIMTGLMQHFSESQMKALRADPHLSKMFKSPEQGAATTVWAATAKVFEGLGGKYLEDCQIAKPPAPNAAQFDPGYSAWAYDEKKATLLWDMSLELVESFLP
jgi:NAD(P)-dependent dehydrogenase (short-subunit alcohol dehydrogenase family)